MKLLKNFGSLWFSIFYLELRKSISAMENLGGGQYWQIHLRIKMKTLFVFGQKKNHLWEIHFANCYLCHGERSRHLHGGRRCNAVLIRGGAGRFPPSNVLSTSKQGFPSPSTASSCSRALGHVEEVLRYFFWIQDRKQRCLEVRWVSFGGSSDPLTVVGVGGLGRTLATVRWVLLSSSVRAGQLTIQLRPGCGCLNTQQGLPWAANWSGSKSFLVPEQRPRLAGESFIFVALGSDGYSEWLLRASEGNQEIPSRVWKIWFSQPANLIRWSNKIRSAEVTEAKFCESENVFYKYFLKLHRVVDEVARARIRWLRGNTN